jgi:hypothetical protein
MQAFRSWIVVAVQDPDLLASKAPKETIGTELPPEVIRHMRTDRVLQSFVDNIWSEMGRCINCHSPERNRRTVEEHGEQVSWIVPNDPEATLAKLVDGGNIDIENPDQSLVVSKPVGLEDHGGGPKFALGSRTDKNFRQFLKDYSAVVTGKYRHREELPETSPDIGILTEQHLRITNLPTELDQRLLKADIYRWEGTDWSETPWGTAESPINGKQNIWQNMVFAIARRGTKRAAEMQKGQGAQLPAGRYLVKIYVDRDNRVSTDRDYELGESELIGQVEIDGDWPIGYQPPKIVQAPK